MKARVTQKLPPRVEEETIVPKNLDSLLSNIVLMQGNLERLKPHKQVREWVIITYEAHLDVLYHKHIDDYQRNADWLSDYKRRCE